jgi:hypothetical protein
MHGYSKNKCALSRTGTKPISGKVNFLIFESDQGATSDFEITSERLGSVESKADTAPTGHRTTDLRPVVENVPGSIPGIEQVFTLGK